MGTEWLHHRRLLVQADPAIHVFTERDVQNQWVVVVAGKRNGDGVVAEQWFEAPPWGHTGDCCRGGDSYHVLLSSHQRVVGQGSVVVAVDTCTHPTPDD